MHEYSPSPARPRPWPAPPGQEPEPQEQERIFAGAPATDRAAVAEIISITGDTRRLTHLSGGLLGAVLAGAAVAWDYIAPLIAATRRQHERTRCALSAAVLTTAAFLVWMVLSLTMAAPT